MSSRHVATAVALIMLVPIALPLVPTAVASVNPETSGFTFTNYPAPSPFGRGTNEPTIGVNWETGKVFTIAMEEIYSVTFNDLVSPATALWQNAASGEINSQINVDPILFTDSEDGRTYAGGLDGACSILAYTDDDGANWIPMTNSCAPPGWDHQTVFAGPWHDGELKDTAIYDRAVYYCSQPGLTQGPAFCGVSQDGGLTFRDSIPMYELFECHGLHGKGKIAPDGTVGVPNKGCLENAAAVLSEDNGLTWNIRTMPGTVKGRFDPALAWTTDNWLYLGATGGDGRAVIGMSKTKGVTWENVKDVTPPGVAVTEFAQLIAGDNERAAFAFLGSDKGPNTVACNNAGQQIWHMYVSMTYNGGATWETKKISTDPVQRGPIGDPNNSACRNMLDFNDMTVDAQGRVLVAYTDGCTGSCAGPTGTVASSNGGVLTIARQSGGRGLFADEDAAFVEIVAPLVGAVGSSLTLSANVDASAPYTATVTWGDASPAEVFSGQSAALFTASHSYGSSGEYDITLTVVGSDSASASDTTTATISGDGGGGSIRIDEPLAGASVGDFVTVSGVTELGSNLPPSAAFTFAVSGTSVTFDASGSSDPEGNDLVFVWAFGDGDTGGGVNPQHTYGSAGTYNACLTVSDGILSDELCTSVTIGSTSTRTLIANDPKGDAKNPVPADPAGVVQNVPSLDIRMLEAEINPSGEPVFTLTLDSIQTPTAPTGEGADGAVWRIAWTNPAGKTDFVQVSVTALGTVQGGYGDTDTNGIFSQRGAAPFTFTAGTPGKFTMTYPTAALASRGYTPGATMASLLSTTHVYRGSPQDVPVSAGGTTQYDGTTPSSYTLTNFDASIAPIGYVNTQAAKPAPTAPPANPHIRDIVSDPVGDNTPTLNIISGWFDSDAENLYIGAKIADIPADSTATAFLYYSINFKPSWDPVDARWNNAVPAANTFTGLRVTALYSPVGKDGTTPTTADSTQFELQALSVNGAQNNFGRVANITGTISPTTDIIWWIVPRSTLQNPAGGEFVTTTSGASAPAIGGTVTFGTAFGDSTGTGDDYVFPGQVVTPPTVTLVATPASGNAPLSVNFAATATGTSIASWTLTYGDGETTSASGAVPASFTHIYDGEGAYVATLTAIATNGASATAQATVTVGSSPAPVDVIVSVDGLGPITATCLDDCATWTANLDLSSLPPGDLTIGATLRNDGTPIATDSVQVTLVRVPTIAITAPADGADVPTGQVVVSGQITGSSNEPPMAIMSADRSEGVAPLTVTFSLSGSDDTGIASWRFESGDGNVIDGATLPATHVETYAAAGTYNPRFTVTDTNGATDSVIGFVRAQAQNTAPTVPANPSPANGATGVALTTALSYSSTDVDGNTLTYDVYLDTTDGSTLVATDQTSSYLASGLLGSTTYFWRVVVSDGTESVSGPTWSFTTTSPAISEADKPQVVVATTDTGINPYSTQFRRSHLTENPANYIAGMPANVKQINLCFFDNVTKTVDQSRCPASPSAAPDADAAEWAKVLTSSTSQVGAGQGNLYWFAGTNVFVMSFSHSGAAGFVGLDGAKGNNEKHGTGTASDIVGATTGTCPECFVVMIEAGLNLELGPAYHWMANQPYVDVITSSVSCGPLGHNPGGIVTPICGAPTSTAVKNAVTRGKLVFQASGNGIGNAGAAPTTTVGYEAFNPWIISVGCVQPNTGQLCPYSDSPNQISATGAFRFVAAPNSYTGTESTAGTSFASPSAAGVAARTIYALRAMYSDTIEGPTSTGEKSIVRTGTATLPTSGPLANGAITRLELEEVLFKTARRDILPKVPGVIGIPAEGVNTPLNFIKEGYGEVYRGAWGVNHTSALSTWSSSGDALSVILGNKALPNRWLEETWWETVVEPSQVAMYGAEVPDSDVDAFPKNDAFDPSGLDGYTGTSIENVVDVVATSATVPVGSVPTPSQNRLYFHHNVLTATTYEKYLNSVANPAQGNSACAALNPSPACPDWTGIGATGAAPAGSSATYTVLHPTLGGPVLLDMTKDIVIHVEASGFAQPPTPLSLRATVMSAGALVGTGASGIPTVVPPFDGIYEIRFKPAQSVLTDLVEVTIAWDGPAYSFHLNSQGASWVDFPIAATLPPVDYEPVTYFLDDFNAFGTNGGTVTLTRDSTKLAGDASANKYWTFPQATGLVINLVSDDALATGDALLASAGSAQVYMCTNQAEAGAAAYTAKMSLSVDGVPIGGGSITKEMFGPNTGRTVPVSIPLTLNAHLIEQGKPLTGTITLSGPGGVFAENQGVCGGGADRPWKLTLGIAELDTSPTADIGSLPATITGVQTISGTASFPAVPGVGEVTWYAQDMATWDTMHDSLTLDTGSPGSASPGPFLEPTLDGIVLTFTSARDARADAPVIAANGLGTASFWVSGIPAATDVTVSFTMLLQNGASQRTLGSGSLTKHVIAPLGTVAPIWDEQFIIGFTPQLTDPQPGEKLVMIVRVHNLPGGGQSGHISCLCGGPDMPVYVTLPIDQSATAASPVVDLSIGELDVTAPVVNGAWSASVDTRTIANGDYTVTATPRALYGGVSRTGIADTLPVSVSNVATNTPPTATLGVSPMSGIAPLSVTASLGGSDAQTGAGALEWSLNWGDGSAATSGTGVPASASHSYALGNYVATLTVTDAGGMIATATASVSAFAAPPVEKVVVLLDGAGALDATDVTGDGSFRDWSATFSIPTGGVHSLVARHVRGDEVLSEAAIGFNTIGTIDVEIHAPATETVVGNGAAIVGSTTHDDVVTAVEASIDGFVTTTPATTTDGFATWSVDVDALGLPEDIETVVAIRATAEFGNGFDSLTLTRNAAPNPLIEIVTALPVLTGETVQFQAGGTLAEGGAAIVDRAWTFGNGATSAETNPTASYVDDGTYTVTLTVTDAAGEIGSTSATVLVLNRLPTVTLVTTPTDPTTLDSVTLNAGASDVDGTIASITTTAYAGPTRDSGVLESGGASLTLQFPDDGDFLLVARAVDNDGDASETESVLTVHNVRPIAALVATPTLIGQGQDVTFDAGASSDPDGTVVEYRFDPGDSSGIVTQATPTLIHTYENTGVFQATVTVVDDDGSSIVSAPVEIRVNGPPVLANVGNKNVAEGGTLTFTLSATDPEGDALTYSVNATPAGAALNPTTGAFSWTPTFSQEGTYFLQFAASDGISSHSRNSIISVGNVPLPPTLDPIGPKSGIENSMLVFTVTASDPDTPYTLSATGLPTGAVFDASTGTFGWTPTFAQAGTYTVTFSVADGSFTLSEAVVITIANSDRAPTLNAFTGGSVLQLSTITIPLTASDPDGETITFSVDGPAGMVVQDLGGGNARLVWTPAIGQLGAFNATVFAASGELAASRTATITALFKTDLALTQLTPSTQKVSPGQTITLSTILKNTGPQTDTFNITVVNSVTWATTPAPAPITLASGESAYVNITVVADGAKPISQTTVKAVSLNAPNVAKTVTFRVDIPVLVNVVVDTLVVANETISDKPSGRVTVTHLDGTPAIGATVSATQTPDDFGLGIAPALRGTRSGTTNDNGIFAFDFTQQSGGAAPGPHQLVIVAKKPGGYETVIVTSYTIVL